jgi:cell division protein FtsB
VKIIASVLLVLFIWLQYKIWLQDGGIPEILQLQDEVKQVKSEVETLRERNASLDAEVKDLKKGLEAIEERARSEMGMIKKGEVYYQVIEPVDHGAQTEDQDREQTGSQATSDDDNQNHTQDDDSGQAGSD